MKHLRLVLLSLFVVLMTFPSSGRRSQHPEVVSAVAPPSPDTVLITTASADWHEAMVAKDVTKSVSFYDEDAMVFSNRAWAVRGTESIRKGLQQMLSLPDAAQNFTPTGLVIAHSGDLAWQYGTYEFAMTDKGGAMVREKGKFVTVWRKEAENNWKAVGVIKWLE
jgi:ketosteroid isomerase-like protein